MSFASENEKQNRTSYLDVQINLLPIYKFGTVYILAY